MNTKALTFGIVGFLLGGLTVSVAASLQGISSHSTDGMSMSQMNEELSDKTGDEFDSLFISHMTDHHEGAVDMAKLALKNAKHPEIKQLATDIVSAQEKEINQMEQWRTDWGYKSAEHDDMSH